LKNCQRLVLLLLVLVFVILTASSCKTDAKVEVSEIYLSKNNLQLGVGETADLSVTISPESADAKLSWSSSNDGVAKVDSNGHVEAISEGDAAIKVITPNGKLAICNIAVKTKVGNLSGTITWKYNDFVGHRGDNGSCVWLISKNVDSIPDTLVEYDELETKTDEIKGYYYATVADGNGNYSFDNIPVGDYYIVVKSNNTNNRSYCDIDECFGPAGEKFSSEIKEIKKNFSIMKYTNSSVTIYEGQTATFSHDFGITWSKVY